MHKLSVNHFFVSDLPVTLQFIKKANMGKEEKHFEFYKENDDDVIFWVDNVETIGEFLFTFDKKKIYNLFADYPHNLTKEEKSIFDKENHYWRDFFADRNG